MRRKKASRQRVKTASETTGGAGGRGRVGRFRASRAVDSTSFRFFLKATGEAGQWKLPFPPAFARMIESSGNQQVFPVKVGIPDS